MDVPDLLFIINEYILDWKYIKQIRSGNQCSYKHKYNIIFYEENRSIYKPFMDRINIDVIGVALCVLNKNINNSILHNLVYKLINL